MRGGGGVYDFLAFAVPQTVVDAIWQGVLAIIGCIFLGMVAAIRILGKQGVTLIQTLFESWTAKIEAKQDSILDHTKQNAAGIENLRDGGTKDAVKAALAETGVLTPKGD